MAQLFTKTLEYLATKGTLLEGYVALAADVYGTRATPDQCIGSLRINPAILG